MEFPCNNLHDLLAQLAAVSVELDDRQQRHHGLRAGATDNLELSVHQAEIKSMKRRQADLRRQILACNEWDESAIGEHVA